jgi:hypothetical protein
MKETAKEKKNARGKIRKKMQTEKREITFT